MTATPGHAPVSAHRPGPQRATGRAEYRRRERADRVCADEPSDSAKADRPGLTAMYEDARLTTSLLSAGWTGLGAQSPKSSVASWTLPNVELGCTPYVQASTRLNRRIVAAVIATLAELESGCERHTRLRSVATRPATARPPNRRNSVLVARSNYTVPSARCSLASGASG